MHCNSSSLNPPFLRAIPGVFLAILAACSGSSSAPPAPGSKAGTGSELQVTRWSGSTSAPLLAEKTMRVGTVTAFIEGEQLVVKYVLDPPWTMTESYLDIENDWHLIPQTNTHNPIPGHFAFKSSHEGGENEWVYSKALTPSMGPTLYIAAHAEVMRASGGPSEGAWAGGTRFTEKGSWGTYFTLTPQAVIELAHGPDWKLTKVQGTLTDDPTQVYNQNVFMLHNGDGVSQAPLPATVKADLSASLDPSETLFFVNQHIADEIERSEREGKLTPDLLAIAEPNGSVKPLSGCADRDTSVGKTIGISSPMAETFNLADGLQGKLSFNGNIQGSAIAELNLVILRAGIFGLCVPYGVKYRDVHAFGSASVVHGSSIEGTLSYERHWSKEVAKPTVASFAFMIGPVPVVFGLNLPISVGFDLAANATGDITYQGTQTLAGSFDYRCPLSGCYGNAGFNPVGPQAPTVTAGATARIQISPWVQGAVRLFLYDDNVAYGQIGIKPYAYGDLWGYYGSNCGDADGDGTPETVSALTIDIDWQLYITGAVSALGHNAEWNDLYHTQRGHLAFLRPINSDAMTPMILGPAVAGLSVPQQYSAKMRPCWPYSDDVNYQLAWGDGAVSNLRSAPQTAVAASHAWQAMGPQTISLMSVQDEHGRPLGQTTSRSIRIDPSVRVTLTGTGTGTVTSTPSGVDCPAGICAAAFPSGTQVTLRATAGQFSQFQGWSGAGCTGTGDCTVTLTAAAAVEASFAFTGCTGGSCDGQCTGDCNGDPRDGCEINLSNDINNCGACGNRCLGQYAVCQNSRCITPGQVPLGLTCGLAYSDSGSAWNGLQCNGVATSQAGTNGGGGEAALGFSREFDGDFGLSSRHGYYHQEATSASPNTVTSDGESANFILPQGSICGFHHTRNSPAIINRANPAESRHTCLNHDAAIDCPTGWEQRMFFDMSSDYGYWAWCEYQDPNNLCRNNTCSTIAGIPRGIACGISAVPDNVAGQCFGVDVLSSGCPAGQPGRYGWLDDGRHSGQGLGWCATQY